MYHTRPEAVVIISKSPKPHIDFTIQDVLHTATFVGSM